MPLFALVLIVLAVALFVIGGVSAASEPLAGLMVVAVGFGIIFWAVHLGPTGEDPCNRVGFVVNHEGRC